MVSFVRCCCHVTFGAGRGFSQISVAALHQERPGLMCGGRGMATGMAVSNDGSLLVTISRDQSVKVFDVPGFDMVLMLKLPFVPKAAEWIFRVRRLHVWCRGTAALGLGLSVLTSASPSHAC
jgi:hypothetical protein